MSTIGNFRFSKARRYSALPASAGGYGAGAYVFDALCDEPDFLVETVIVNGVTNATVFDGWVVPQRMVIVKGALYASTGAAFQTTDAFNIVVGQGAETGSAGTGQTIQAAGNSMFAADKALSTLVASANFQTFSFIPDVPEAWYDAGQELTLRLVTGATAGGHFVLPNTSGHLVPAAIAVGVSPFTYTNNDGVIEVVSVQGGTVSAITQDGTATGVVAGMFTLAPGSNIAVTYTVAPTTFTKFPFKNTAPFSIKISLLCAMVDAFPLIGTANPASDF